MKHPFRFRNMYRVRPPQALAVLFWLGVLSFPSLAAKTGNNLLTTAIKLRLEANAPVVIDPDIITLKLLSVPLEVDANNRASALIQLRRELMPLALKVTEQDGIIWITKADIEPDLSQQIALVVNSKNPQLLARALALQTTQRPSDLRLKKLAEMADFMNRQFALPLEARKFIENQKKTIKHLLWLKRNAEAGSTLSPPNPAEAEKCQREIEEKQEKVMQYISRVTDQLKASDFDPGNPVSAPPAIYAVSDTIPPVLFQKLAFENAVMHVRVLEELFRAWPDFGFSQDSQALRDIQSGLRGRLDAIKKSQIDNQLQVERYMDLLQRAGLLDGSAASGMTASPTTGVAAANELYNVFEDQREAVRIAIGKNIMQDLEKVSRSITDGKSAAVKEGNISELYLLGEKELQNAVEAFGPPAVSIRAYRPAGHERLGAVTGLTVRGKTGKGGTDTFSVQLQPLGAADSSERSLQNILGSPDKVVAINTSADLAVLDGILLGKGGAHVATADAALGGGGMIGSVSEALELVKNDYDPALFKNRITLGFDKNFDILFAGDSAGVAMALAALSRVKSKPLDSRLMVTGAVRQFGDVRPVGGIYAKGTAALEAGALALLMPVSNLGGMLNLPVSQIITRHFVSLERFKDAANLSLVVATPDGQAALEAICLFNYAVVALSNDMTAEALALCEKAVIAYPNHISAQVLRSLISATGVTISSDEKVNSLALQAKAFANLMTTNQAVISSGSTSTVGGAPQPVMAVILPDFTVANIKAEDAFAMLNDKAKAASGQSPNINIRKKNPYFSNTINLSIQNKTVEEVLKELCELCEASFEIKGSAVVVESLQSPIPADVSALVIPDYTVSGLDPAEAFKLLASKAQEVSGKSVNISIESHENFWTDLAITLSMQRKTFKEIIEQLCAICDATMEQRGDSFVIKVVK